MMEYDLVISDDDGEMQTMVNMALQEGWMLQGGLALAHVPKDDGDRTSTGYTLYGQALVRERQEEPPPCSH